MTFGPKFRGSGLKTSRQWIVVFSDRRFDLVSAIEQLITQSKIKIFIAMDHPSKYSILVTGYPIQIFSNQPFNGNY